MQINVYVGDEERDGSKAKWRDDESVCTYFFGKLMCTKNIRNYSSVILCEGTFESVELVYMYRKMEMKRERKRRKERAAGRKKKKRGRRGRGAWRRKGEKEREMTMKQAAQCLSRQRDYTFNMMTVTLK